MGLTVFCYDPITFKIRGLALFSLFLQSTFTPIFTPKTAEKTSLSINLCFPVPLRENMHFQIEPISLCFYLMEETFYKKPIYRV